MRHGIELGRVQHARDQVEGSLPRFRPTPVRDRDERGFEWLQFTDGTGERGQLLVVLGREELEGVGRPGRQEIGNPCHRVGTRP